MSSQGKSSGDSGLGCFGLVVILLIVFHNCSVANRLERIEDKLDTIEFKLGKFGK